VKLHLGCGQVYLEGYTNIDFPLDEHTVQTKTVADEFADLTKLRYKGESIEEVRLHHTYEHFNRPVALALLASWHSWLKMGGRMHIEVPDFDGSAKVALSRFSSDRDRKVALRHIFGSNEAPWATHYEGWSKERLIEVFSIFGFAIESTEKTAYLATRNITIIGVKDEAAPSKEEMVERAKMYLTGFTLDESEFETRLLGIWLDQFKEQLKQTIAK
jgi:hypothetical protein